MNSRLMREPIIREAERLQTEADRIKAKREELQTLHMKKQDRIVKLVGKPSGQEFKKALAMDITLAKRQAQLQTDSDAAYVFGLNPQEAWRWLRMRQQARKIKAKNKKT